MGRPKGSKNKSNTPPTTPSPPDDLVAKLDLSTKGVKVVATLDPKTDAEALIEAGMDDEELAKLTLDAADGFATEVPVDDTMPVMPPEPAPSKVDTTALDSIAAGFPLPADFKLGRKAYTIGEAFGKVASFPTKAQRVAWLRHNDKLAFRFILKLAFDPNIVWKLPPGCPPYKPHRGRPGSAPSELLRESRRLYLFLEGGNDRLPRLKREKLFQQTIEGLEPEDVKCLVALKDHTVAETFGITTELVDMAFPGLLTTPTQLRF